jgi:hypothetical protein
MERVVEVRELWRDETWGASLWRVRFVDGREVSREQVAAAIGTAVLNIPAEADWEGDEEDEP